MQPSETDSNEELINSDSDTTVVRASFRNCSKDDMNALISISKMGNPELHTPIKDLYQQCATDQLETIRKRVFYAIGVYVKFADNDANNWMNLFLEEIKLEPEKQQEIFDKHRNDYINLLKEHRKFQYIYTDFYGKAGQWSYELQKNISKEIWNIVTDHDEQLMEGLWLFQRVYSYYFVIGKLNTWKNQQSDNPINNTKDIRYYLSKEFLESYDSQYLTESIESNRYFSIKYNQVNARAYVGPLAAFLTNQQVDVKNLDEQTMEIIDGTAYLKTYITAYVEGQDYFDKRFGVSAEILFGPKSKEYCEGLHFQYFHSNGNLGGWNHWRYSIPKLITHKVIKEYGYYTGIISRFDDMAYEYPELFNKHVFRACDKEEENTSKPKDSLINEDKLVPALHIVPESRQALYNVIAPFVNESERPTLFALIFNNKLPPDRITVTCLLKTFGLSFFTARAVPEQGAKLLSEQLPDYFIRNEGTRLISLKPSILVKYLRGNR